MNYRVIKYFIDRDSLKEFNMGDLFPCVDEKRAEQLIFKGYIVREQEKSDKQPAKKEPTKTAKAKSTTKKAATKKKA